MSAAHELVTRGYTVRVFERQSLPGGKARSVTVDGTGTDGRKDLPGEHGFRFFPRFYRHVIDTMERIPVGSGTAAGNLVQASREEIAINGTHVDRDVAPGSRGRSPTSGSCWPNASRSRSSA